MTLNKICIALLFLFGTFSIPGFAQQITFPENKAVFQRSNQNTGMLPVRISGTWAGREIRLTVSLNGSPFHTIDIPPTKNSLDTLLECTGGMYDLKLSGYTAQGQEFSREIQAGIGEVFLISGQSNAESEGPNAKDERVIGAYAARDPKFISLTSSNNYNKWLYPSQPGTSFTGALGDSLVKYLNVPVLFLNAATGGMSSSDFYTSALNESLPYAKLDWAIYQYLKTYGVRGILWHQGESNSLSYAYHWTAQQYRDQVKYIIDKTRTNLGYPDLSWMIALVSWTKQATTPTNDPNAWVYREPTRNGQTLLTQSGKHIYPGPDSDRIEGHIGSETRPDGVHLSYLGMSMLGNLWFQKMKEGYLHDSEPFLPNRLPQQITAIEKLQDHCLWQKIGVKTNSGLPLTYQLLQGNATIAGDSIRIWGMGSVTVKASHPGNGTYSPIDTRTLTFWPDISTENPESLEKCIYLFRNEPVTISTVCRSGTANWYRDLARNLLVHSGDSLQITITSNDQSYFVTCQKKGCETLPPTNTLPPANVRLMVKDCISNHDLPNLRQIKNLKAASPDKILYHNKISDESVVTFTAKDHILLEPGTVIEAGSVFTADINGCTNSY